MTTWAEFRDDCRYILNDTTDRYSDDVLLCSYKFATATLCEHTALASGVTYANPTGLTYDLPTNVYEGVDIAGIVYLEDSDGVAYLDPVHYTDGISLADEFGFSVWNNVLTLNSVPDTGKTLEVRYFAYYPVPAADSDVIQIPTWAEAAVAHLVGSFVMTTQANRFRILDQFKDKNDRGVPERSAFEDQAHWLQKQYEILINKHSRQDRSNFFRRER